MGKVRRLWVFIGNGPLSRLIARADDDVVGRPANARGLFGNPFDSVSGDDVSMRVEREAEEESRLLAPMPDGWEPGPFLGSSASNSLLQKCKELLASLGLTGEQGLQTKCAHASECWDGMELCKVPVLPRLPWVGPRYSDTGVLVVGMNAQTHQGLWDEAYCVDQALHQLSLGRQRFFGAKGQSSSWFHYRAAVIATMLALAQEGSDPAIVAPVDAGEGLLRTARIQLVQCSPPSGNRRSPTRSMLEKCPEHLFWPMVRVLGPRSIALLGAEARTALEREFGTELQVVDPLLRVGQVEIVGRQVTVLALRHPSSGFGMQSIGTAQSFLRRGVASVQLGD